MNIELIAIKSSYALHLQDLLNFRFSYLNPLFWISMLIIFMLLSRPWGIKKAFSYCFAVAVVLLATTMLEHRFADLLIRSNLFDFTVLKLITIFVISLITLYYFFIKQ